MMEVMAAHFDVDRQRVMSPSGVCRTLRPKLLTTLKKAVREIAE